MSGEREEGKREEGERERRYHKHQIDSYKGRWRKRICSEDNQMMLRCSFQLGVPTIKEININKLKTILKDITSTRTRSARK